MAVTVNRRLRLPETEYLPEACRKTGIALHHTVCESVRKTLRLWRRDKNPDGSPRRVGTAYIVERDGTIYEVFDPAAWAWQFGLSWPDDRRRAFEKRFIGIEMVSEGGLIERDGQLYGFDRVSFLLRKERSEAFECATPYRGFDWFDRYEPKQLEAVAQLVDDLCGRFSIPRIYPEPPFAYHGEALQSFEGVIGHAMVRSDKSDPAPDPILWRTLRELAGLQPTAVQPSARVATPLNRREIETLFARNVRQLNLMDTAAGSLVKALLMELERRRTYLRLEEPQAGAHTIGYEVAQGDRGQVAPLARSLGFKHVTDSVLEVHDA